MWFLSRAQIRQLQIDLASLGYYNMAIDGQYGNGTRTAVRNFQRDNGLKVDGSAGSITRRAVESAVANLAKGDTKLPEPSKNVPVDVQWLDRQTEIIRVKLSDVEMKVYSANTVQTVSARLKSIIGKKPILIFNGGLFTRTRHMSYAKSDGVELTRVAPSMWAMCQINDRIDLVGITWARNNGREKDITQAIGAYPTLVVAGKKSFDVSTASNFANVRHPRLAFGLDDDYLYAVIVHGRNSKDGHFGATLNEMADLCVRLKLKHAINLDGGGSISAYDGNGKRLDKNPEVRPVKTIVEIYVK